MFTLLHHQRFFYRALQQSTKFKNSTVQEPIVAQSIILEKQIEEPIVVLAEGNDADLIGPPHPISNLRPIIRRRPLLESNLQRKLREFQDATQEWNQEFWAKHNTKFKKERQVFINERSTSEDQQLTPQEMSEFYKKFLDDHWEVHMKYNFAWYRKNFSMTLLALVVELEKIMFKFHRPFKQQFLKH